MTDQLGTSVPHKTITEAQLGESMEQVCDVLSVGSLSPADASRLFAQLPDTGLDVEGVIVELMGAEGSLDKALERLVKATNTLARLTSSPTAEEER